MTTDHLAGYVRTLVHPGFTPFDQVVERVVERARYLHEEEDGDLVTDEAVVALVRHVWDERAAEQRGWPPVTDADRLETAFAALEADGIVARANFTCCQTCGHDEIGDETVAAGPARGFVFFHEQDAEQLVDQPATLYLSFGAFGATDRAGYESASADVARVVVRALRDAGLAASWEGDLDLLIAVTGLTWRRRLPQ